MAGDEVHRLRKLQRRKVLEQETCTAALVLGDSGVQHLRRAIHPVNHRHAEFAQVADKRPRAAGDISSRAGMDTVALDKPIKDALELWEEAIAEEGVVNRGERGIWHSRPPTQASHPAIQT